MTTCPRSIPTFILVVGLCLAQDSAAAGLRGSASQAAGSLAPASLDREFATAMAHMDRNLADLLSSREIECLADDGAGGMEICWVFPDEAAPAAEAMRGPVHP